MRGRLAALSPLAVTNGLGVGGLVLVVVAVGTLAGWRWALLLAGLLMVGVSYLTHVGLSRSSVGAAASAPAPARAGRPVRRLASVDAA